MAHTLSHSVIHATDVGSAESIMRHILGQIDGVDPNFIYGWIANTTHPERLEQVICHGNGGDRITFRACLPRSDVCRALSMRGRFGFTIPTDAARALGPVLRFTNVNGGELVGGSAVHLPPPLNMPQPEGLPRTRPTWVILHIQKTAGTSLRHALSQAIPAGETLYLYPDGFSGLTVAEFGRLPLQQRSWARLVMGHAFYGVADCLPDRAVYATFLRDPAARLRSHYRNHRRAGTVFRMGEGIVPTGLVVQHALNDEFDNLMTRMLAGLDAGSVPIRNIGPEHVDIALHHIRTEFRFVGLVERMAEHYRLLCELLDIPAAALPVDHAAPVETAIENDAGIDWAEALHHNRFDTMLYERVQAERLCGCDLSLGCPGAGTARRHAG